MTSSSLSSAESCRWKCSAGCRSRSSDTTAALLARRHRRPARGRRAPALWKKKKNRRLGWALFILGAVIVAGLTAVGWDYYRLPALERLRSPLHYALKPAGPWGHGIGIGATAVMLSNFLYALRKRWSLLSRAAPLRRWLTFHMFAGFLSPVVIAFHSAFQSKNHLATATAASLAIVVGTGVLGRFVYGLVPTQNGRAVALADLAGRLERLKAVAQPMVANLPKARLAIEALDEDTPKPRTTGLVLVFS